MSRIASLGLSCMCVIALCSVAVRAADEKVAKKGPVIQAAQAKDNVGKEVVVEFVVAGGRMLEDKGICFLNSSTDPSDPEGFTAVIRKAGLGKFKDEAKIDNPADHFSQKKVHVSGKVEKYVDKNKNEKLEIIINSPDQITIVEEGAAEGAAPAGGAPAGEATPENKM